MCLHRLLGRLAAGQSGYFAVSGRTALIRYEFRFRRLKRGRINPETLQRARAFRSDGLRWLACIDNPVGDVGQSLAKLLLNRMFFGAVKFFIGCARRDQCHGKIAVGHRS
jgi:hypothetical protein